MIDILVSNVVIYTTKYYEELKPKKQYEKD